MARGITGKATRDVRATNVTRRYERRPAAKIVHYGIFTHKNPFFQTEDFFNSIFKNDLKKCKVF